MRVIPTAAVAGRVPALLFPALLLLSTAVPAVADDTAASPTGTPQPTLEQIDLEVGEVTVKAEVADEEPERQAGLMFRGKLEEDAGMLFVFSRPQPMGFWMRNTIIPLSIAYISPEGIILEIHDMEPLSERSIRSKFSNILYALEMEQGWFEKKGLLPGDRVAGLPEASEE